MDGAMVTAIPHFPFDSRYRSRIQVYLADVLCDEEYVRLLSLKSEVCRLVYSIVQCNA